MKKTQGVIDRFEGDFAVISINSKYVDIPKELIPEDAKEGDVIFIAVLKNEEEKKNQEELAKSLLNEVLKEK